MRVAAYAEVPLKRHVPILLRVQRVSRSSSDVHRDFKVGLRRRFTWNTKWRLCWPGARLGLPPRAHVSYLPVFLSFSE